MDKPSGLVTFLFTDIEGSTKLSQEYPETIQNALEKHHSILSKSIESNNGFVFEIVGDAFCCAFENAGDAVQAAVDAQLNLTNEKWDDAVIKVRMGIHSGNVEWSGQKYMGYITLARTARVMSASNGAQIIISNDAYTLVKVSVPNQEIGNESRKAEDKIHKDISFRDLGERKLKDLIQPINLFQVQSSLLPSDFPPLKTLDARPNNLPVQLTSFIGREKEISEIKKILTGTRLLTLLGSGGTGKTRLSLQVGADIIDEYENGVFVVELASVQDPFLVTQSVSKALGLKEKSGMTFEKILFDYLKDKEILIILDNCEHLIDACAQLAEKLLQNSPRMKIIATSRETLKCEGEFTHQVLTLAHPDAKEKITPGSLIQYESVRLFIERALAVNPLFRVNNENAAALAQICIQLDGIPLAIELAAARISILPLQQINERLDNRFKLLTGGKRTSLPRQQTLKALIDWSYDLLSEKEKILWERLSVFSGGWTIEASETVCPDHEIIKDDILDILTGLTEKSIVIAGEGRERFRMLETIRQYGENKLKESGTFERISNSHLKYYSELAEIPNNKLRGKDAVFWMNVLKNESENVEKALMWSFEGSGNEDGLKLAGAMSYFWQINGHLSKAMFFLETSLMKHPDSTTHYYNRANSFLGNFARLKGDFSKAKKHIEKSLQICREIGDKDRIADSLHRLAIIEYDLGNYEQAGKYYKENLDYFKSIGDKPGIGRTLNNLGNVFSIQGNFKKATGMYQESLAIRRQSGDDLGVGISLCNLGILAYEQGEYFKAKELLDESLQIRSEIGDKDGYAITLTNLGNLAYQQSDYDAASKLYEECYNIYSEIGDTAGVAESIYNLGRISFEQKEFEKALKLFEENLAIGRQINLDLQIAAGLHGLGRIAFINDEYEEAEKHYSESLLIYREKRNLLDIVRIIISVAELSVETGDYKKAVRLIGFIKKNFLEDRSIKFAIAEQMVLDDSTLKLEEKLSPGEFLEIFEEGKSLTLDEVIEIAVKC